MFNLTVSLSGAKSPELKKLVTRTGLSFYTRRYAVNAASKISAHPAVDHVTLTWVTERRVAVYRGGVSCDE